MCCKQSNLRFVFGICHVTLLKGVYLDIYYFSSLFLLILKYREPLLKPATVHSTQKITNCSAVLTCAPRCTLHSTRTEAVRTSVSVPLALHSSWRLCSSSHAGLLWFLSLCTQILKFSFGPLSGYSEWQQSHYNYFYMVTFSEQELYHNPTKGQMHQRLPREVLPCSNESFSLGNEGFTLLSKYLLICRQLSLQVSQLCHNLYFSHFWNLQTLTCIWVQSLTWSPADGKALTYLLIYCTTVLGIKKLPYW